MSSKAQFYVRSVVVLGLVICALELLHWESQDLTKYGCYLLISVLASSLNMTLPAITGSMSVIFLFVLYGILEFSLPETLLLGCLATLAQCLWNRQRQPRIIQVLFNISCMGIAVTAADATYHSQWLGARHLDTTLILVLTATVFFGASTLPQATALAVTERKSLSRIWRERYFWSFPYYLVGAAIAGTASFATRYIGWQSALLVIPVVYLIYRSYCLYLERVEDEKKHAEEMAELHLRTVEALALAIEAKDTTTHDHLKRVQVYAIEVAKELGLAGRELEALRAAALLHDIGKLAVPEHIISKPGKLTKEEFDKMKIHPVVGSEILERVKFPYPVTPIVRSHHEKWDGSGYPDGLSGEDIPVGARILSAVDCLDALASDRQYRKALPLEEAMQRVIAESGTSFDPKVVNVLSRRHVELEQLAQTNTADAARLSTDLVVERGAAPAAGFETIRKTAHEAGGEHGIDFLASIAAARQEVQNLFELAQDLGNSLSLNETLSLLAIRLQRMIACDSFAVYVQRGEFLKAEYVSGENFKLFSALEIPLGQGLSGWVAENRKPIINGNPSVEPGYLNDPSKITTMRSALSVPLSGLSGAVSVLTLYHADKDAFTKDQLRILLAIAPKIAQSIENALKYEQAENSSSTDYMTGLPNARSLFLHLDGELARCRRSSVPVAVLVCDLNGFKQINDRFGHVEGNRVLKIVAGKFRESCREYDYVARMGGDEFVLILPGLRMDGVQSKLMRLRALTAEAGQEIGGDISLSLSVGYACYPEDGPDAEQLLSEADRRMYMAKQKEKMVVIDRCGYEFDTRATGTGL